MPATSGAPGSGTGPPGAASVLAEGSRWRRVFPGDEGQLGALRQWLSSLLPECPARDDVASVATELGSNAIRHTASGRSGWFAVEVTWLGRPAAVRVAVSDGGAPGGPQVIDDPLAENGRGLMLVRGLADRTGIAGDERGRVVWADIPWLEAGSAPAAAANDPYEAAIRDGLATLAARFAGVPVWFGRATLQWWALVNRGYASKLVSGQSPPELATALEQVLAAMPPAEPKPSAKIAYLGPRSGRNTGPLPVRPKPQRQPQPYDPAALGFAAAPVPADLEPRDKLNWRAS
jgi:anti-sigma regulatory factor (Ser/Thr protein kinase)